MKDLIKNLCENVCIGHIHTANEYAKTQLQKYCKNVVADEFGNVCAIMEGKGDKTILLNAHIDQIGMVITHISENGFLRVSAVGGIDIRVLPASVVMIYGKQTIKGVFTSVPPHLAKGNENSFLPLSDMWIDTGYDYNSLCDIVSVGDYVTYYSPICDLQGDKITGAFLDDRVGCASVIYAAQLLCGKDLPCNVAFFLSNNEETGGKGAKIGSFAIDPDEAIITDVSFAKGPGVPSDITATLGGGAMIGVAPILSEKITDKLISIAKAKNIPFQYEGMGGKTGTDADTISISKAGVPCGLLSVPQRNMHTPVEICSVSDIKAVGEIMAEYCLAGGMDNA